MKHFFLAAGFSLLMTDLSAAQTVLDGSFPQGAPVALVVLNSHLSKGMSDPLSAQYKNIQMVLHTNGNVTFCGYVNSKNKSGEYSDFQPFSVSLDPRLPTRALVASDMPREVLDALVFSDECGQLLRAATR